MEEYLLKNLASLAERKAINIREEAMMWDRLHLYFTWQRKFKSLYS
jgi:hypothetical protein